MTLRSLMQAGPAKANELFTRLSETSDSAVKTREKLFAELKAELEFHTSLEERHLFPVLRRNPETKDLVADAIRDNKELRARLVELDSMAKNDAAFAGQLSDLQKVFRQHSRDDRKELLPAVQRALSDEQVQGVTDRMEAGIAEAEQARQDEAEERRAKARQEREQAEFLARQAELRAHDDTTPEPALAVVLAPMAATARAVENIADQVTATLEVPAARNPSSALALSNIFLWPWLGAPQGGQGSAIAKPRGVSGMEEVIPLGEETLEVGKRTENRGTTRIRRFVVETPVEREITLHSERVVVERRRAVRELDSGTILTELTVEIIETDEVPIIKKRVRLREEIVVRTERTQRTETVKETLRRDEVEIQQPGARRGARRLRATASER